MGGARMLAAALALAAGAGHAEAPPARHPTADFARLPFFEQPAISPDGKTVVARIAVQGTQYLGSFSLADAKPRLLGMRRGDINWWRWVNDAWLVVGIGDTIPVEDQEFYMRRALGVSVDMTTQHWLIGETTGQNADDLLWTATDGSPRVLLSAQHSVYYNERAFWPDVTLFDVSTGRGRAVVSGQEGIVDWYADGGGTVRMGAGALMNGRLRRLVYRADGTQRFHELDRADSRKGEELVQPALFLADPNAALAVVDDDHGFGTLAELDLRTLKPGRTLFAAKSFDVGAIVTGADGATLAGVRVDEDGPVMHWIDPVLAEVQAALDKAVTPRRATIVSLSRDKSRLIVLVGGPDQPGRYFVFDAGDGRLHPLTWVNDAFQGPLHPVRTIRYKARDGLEIAAVLTLPSGRAAKALPLIVMPHGGPFARDDESWDWWAQFLADRGYAVIQPNYRGSSGYGTPFEKKGEGQWGLAMQDDLNDAVAWAAQAGIADPRRVCMVGGSYGGYAALRAAERDGKVYRCAVSYAGVSDLNALRRYDSQFLMGGATGDRLRRQAPDFRLVSPLDDPQGFSIPVLIVHGKADKRVPVAQSRQMAAKLKAAGKPVTYLEQPLADHFFTREADRLQFLEALEAFLKTNNPADG